jgi:peroxiredoxin
MTERLDLSFPVLSDASLAWSRAMRLPTFEVAGAVFLQRLTLVLSQGRVVRVFYPVAPDTSALDVLAWMDRQTPG